MKNRIIVILLLLMSIQLFSQERYLTKEGYISFFSHSLVEDIKADNYQVLSVIDKKTGEIAIQLLMKSFMFKKALMQEHFNQSYVESYKYPKATFKGYIQNLKELDVQNETVEIKGILSLHGKEKEISTIANIQILKDQINLSGHFMVEVADFDIKIPIVVRNNIAKTIKITFDLQHKPYK
ncbi:MAG: YceI family protein [Lutibacter sp.]|nr:YceI family protein [Lutibacter sp.]